MCIKIMMQSSPLLKQADLPFIDELSKLDLRELQYATARMFAKDTTFHDQLSNQLPAPQLAIIPAGRFDMGSNTREYGHRRDEGPVRLVTIPEPFAIGQLPVLAEEFLLFQQAIGWKQRPELIWHQGRYPVINVRISDAKQYLTWLSAETGQTYRLPTEAEWEYAARAGTRSAFCFGATVTCKEVHFNPLFPYPSPAQFSLKSWLPRCMPSIKADPAGLREPNDWHLYDMHGNVWEYTCTPWGVSSFAPDRTQINRQLDAEWYVTKGGSWFDGAIMARSAARKKRNFDELDTNLSFRVVREL